MSVKINQFEFENVKRIKAVRMTPTENGLTVIGGKNGQGKTSVIDAIAWALGGEKYRPSEPTREGSVIPPNLKVELSNGIVVERRGKNSSLTVTDSTGKKAGQMLLDDFISKLALDLPSFMNATNKEKAHSLLQIIGISEQLAQLQLQESSLYNERLAVGRIADQKKKYADEMTSFEGVPSEPLSATDLILRQQNILLKNAENKKQREQFEALKKQKQELETQIAKLTAELTNTISFLEQAEKTVEQLQDENTEQITEDIANIEDINRKVRANLDKEKAEEDAKEYSAKYMSLSENSTAFQRMGIQGMHEKTITDVELNAEYSLKTNEQVEKANKKGYFKGHNFAMEVPKGFNEKGLKYDHGNYDLRISRNVKQSYENLQNDFLAKVGANADTVKNKVSEKQGVTIQKVVSVNGNTATYKLTDGRVVSSNATKYKTMAEGILYESALSMGLDAQGINALVQTFKAGRNKNAQQFLIGAYTAIEYGKIGYDGDLSKYLSPGQKEILYGIGERLAKEQQKAQYKKQNKEIKEITSFFTKREARRSQNAIYEMGSGRRYKSRLRTEH